jgi:(p)ppGpp synthase/HD superfamily hydrolase
MINATVLTDRFDRALLYATHVHGGQVRKGTSIPYVAHLLAVAATVPKSHPILGGLHHHYVRI